VDDDDDDYEVDDDDDDDVDDDDVDDDDVGEILKKTKRKPATKIANQRRKIRRFPNRKTCCFAGAQGYSCRHKGDSNAQATRCVPESERNNFPEDAMCCEACYRHFKYSNVPCCFAGAQGYSCHKGDSNAQARNRVPESERNKFPEDARCCATCYNHLQDAHFFHLGRVCSDCLLLGYDPATTPGAWMAWRGLHGNTLLCSKCFANKSKERVRRRKGIMKRRKGRKAKGDW